jgi:CubicO group peptidase (beta-lactamase class C family)
MKPLPVARRFLPGLTCLAAITALSLGAQTPNRYAPPAFTDASRQQQVQSLLPEIDKLFTELAAEKHIPGLAYGVMLDGKMVHARTLGLADVEKKIPVTTDTRFRIASMTKSFVAMAALMLRDAGKLSLDDPVTKYLPEFRSVRPPTSDSAPITVRNLMTMTTGLPEDNPWGDRQMSMTNEALAQFVSTGLSFSNPPNQNFEYSNLGFSLLGKIVSKVSGLRFQDYITRNILQPLGMKNTVWEYTDVPADKFALGYHWEKDTWKLEPILHDGDAAAMGGLITSLDDFARYVALHLDAWPARDDADIGPVRRATVREMHQPRIFSGLASRATLLDKQTPNPAVSFYAYGLGWRRDSRGTVTINHSGGLPGYGSIYFFCPDHGVAVIAFSNLRYGPVYGPSGVAINMLLERAKLQPRAVSVSAILETRKRQVAEMIRSWDPKLVAEITAENFLLDRSLADWTTLARERFAAIGNVMSVGAIVPANQLRGAFPIQGEKGKLTVRFTLTPELVPKVQELDLMVNANQ